MPPAQIKVLALRRLAHPVTGKWLTATKEVAKLIGATRATAQKALRRLEQAQYVHIRHLRTSTVELLLYFGGFADPGYRREGLPPLKWDEESTPQNTPTAHHRSQSGTSRHSGEGLDPGSTRPPGEDAAHPDGTVPRTENERKRNIRSTDTLSTGTAYDPTLMPVDTYVPSMHDEAEVHELARKMGEQYMNSFLSLRRTYGLNRLKRACAFAQDKMFNRMHPLKGRPGAYVRWLLMSNTC